jgi:hypothetical protein
LSPTGHPVTVIDLDVSFKAEALHAADRVATPYPGV